MSSPAILLVCHANRCRSPLAAALLEQSCVAEETMADWRIESAGLHAQRGLPTTALTRRVAYDDGLDLSDHRARSIDDLVLSDYDLILTMECFQAEALAVSYPALADRIHPFSALVDLATDIEDPTVEGSLMAHRALRQLLGRYLQAGLPRLRQMVEEVHER